MEMECFPFAPQINPTSETLLALNSSAQDPRPVHQRLADAQRHRLQRKEELRLRLEAEQPTPFRPSINPVSEAITQAALAAGGGGPFSSASPPPVAHRLACEASALAERKAQREAQALHEEAQQCTFAPKVDGISARLAEGADNGGRSVFRRLDSWATNREERRQHRHALAETEQAKLFRPRVSDATDILLTARPGRLRETESQRIDRLAYADAARKSAQLDDARQAEAEAHPFRPRIDAISARLARPKTDDEMVADARGRARREAAAAAWRAREEEGCTFRPRVSAASAAMAERVTGRLHPADQATLSARLERARASRDARLEQARKASEQALLQPCTFAPRPSKPPPPRPPAAPAVAGLDRFLDRRSLATRQALELAAREAKVFNAEAVRSSSLPFTVPVPFELSSNAG